MTPTEFFGGLIGAWIGLSISCAVIGWDVARKEGLSKRRWFFAGLVSLIPGLFYVWWQDQGKHQDRIDWFPE